MLGGLNDANYIGQVQTIMVLNVWWREQGKDGLRPDLKEFKAVKNLENIKMTK